MGDFGESNKPTSEEINALGNYAILNNSEQRAVLKRRGIDMVNESVDADMVIFLDKTARPLAHLYRKLFPVVHSDVPMPKIKFLNIGTEKLTSLYSYDWGEENTEQVAETGKIKAWRLPNIERIILAIHTRDDLDYFFDKENVDQLVKVLEVGDKPKKRLIVDDVEDSGKTKKLAEAVIAAADPKGLYAVFMFLESPEDREAFRIPDAFGKTNRSALSWHGDVGFVEDRSVDYLGGDPSFVTRRAADNSGRDYSLRVRKELDMLIDEIKGEVAQKVST